MDQLTTADEKGACLMKSVKTANFIDEILAAKAPILTAVTEVTEEQLIKNADNVVSLADRKPDLNQ